MTFAVRRNRLTTHFSERILVVKRRISVYEFGSYLTGNAVCFHTKNQTVYTLIAGLILKLPACKSVSPQQLSSECLRLRPVF